MNSFCRRSFALLRKHLWVAQQRNFSEEVSAAAAIKDEWWSVDGRVVRIRGGEIIRPKEEYELVANPKPMNLKKIRIDRIKRAAETKIKDRPGQSVYWQSYLKNLQFARTEWETLCYEGPPKEQVAVNFNLHIDHYKVLGIERRHEPFSLQQLKNAFKRRAKLYQPDPRERGKYNAGAAAKFRQLFNSYKALSSQKNRI